ncbi:MAG: ribonuclease J [Acidimicrobiia bacterium]
MIAPIPRIPNTEPAPPADNGLQIVALGGIGEIGRNMTVFEYAGRLLVVDCGVLFPEDDAPGVDLILPDFRPIENRLDDIEALVLTHGHEDHIGAVPFLLRLRPDLPVVGSKFTLALLKAKCREHRQKPILVEVREGTRYPAGVFDCEFLAVNHSIPDGLAVAIRTPAGLVLHTGDFKLDQLPIDGRLTDLGGFSRLGDEGVDLLLIDSTNADSPGFVVPERDLRPVIEGVFAKAPGRIVVSSFASHVHRIQQILDIAEHFGRKACFVGRSMVRNMTIASDLGYLCIPDGLLMEINEAACLPESEVVLVSTGSQGEPLSALARMARGEHRQISIHQDDTVLLASSLVPGNEAAVYGVINGLVRRGANVIHRGIAPVHTGGHATAGELLFVYNAVRPSNVMPNHGEWRHLMANADLAVLSGVKPESILLAENGVTVDLADGTASISGRWEVGEVYVDGAAVGDVGDATLSERLVLGVGGFISIVVAIDALSGRAVTAPTISGKGFSDDPKSLDAVLSLVESELKRTETDKITDTHRVAQSVRRVVGRWVADTYRRRPMIVPTVVKV